MDETPAQPSPTQPLVYEETPVIEPLPAAPTPPALGRRAVGLMGFIGNFVLFLALFAVGVFLSTLLRQFMPTGVQKKVTSEPTVTPVVQQKAVSEATLSSQWKKYEVLSGTTKQAIAGISFQLPPDVLAPICDGTTCASQGTYLPGGTRLTVAARGTNQGLGYSKGAVITDASGQPFATKQTTVSARPALEY